MVMSPRAASQLYLPTLITFISFNNTSTPALLPQLGATLQEFLGTMQRGGGTREGCSCYRFRLRGLVGVSVISGLNFSITAVDGKESEVGKIKVLRYPGQMWDDDIPIMN